MLGIRTRGGRMEGADESTELWRHPCHLCSLGASWIMVNLMKNILKDYLTTQLSIHSDWFNLITWLATSNHNDLFQWSVIVTLLLNLFIRFSRELGKLKMISVTRLDDLKKYFWGNFFYCKSIRNNWRLFTAILKTFTLNYKLTWLLFRQHLEKNGALFIPTPGHTD